MVAPAYHEDTFVDHQLSANLDLTFAFEGPEKLLELWFFDSDDSIPTSINQEGLRLIPMDNWVELLDLVNCKVLSMKSTDKVDAYLLSELSLFVFRHKLILKTCGTTTTLACLDRLFEILNQTLFQGLGNCFESKDTLKIFYLRRSFMFPLKQKHVHRDWKHEVALLNKFFCNGKSYVVGDFASDDHWYLYTGGSQEQNNQSSSEGKHLFTDQTFEILMTELAEDKAKKFSTSRKPGLESLIQEDDEVNQEESDLGHELGLETMQKTKLDTLLYKAEEQEEIDDFQLPSPSHSDIEIDEEMEKSGKSDQKSHFIHDAFSFTPCGFSSNSITKSGIYYTLHITPESGWSYASFETNYPFHKDGALSVTDVLIRVLNVFEPGKFSATLFTDESTNPDTVANIESLSNCSDLLLTSFKNFGYEKQEKVLYDLKGRYQLLYMNYAKFAKSS